jgi:3-hydroxybutyryl-CoA dehydrogenase
VSEGRDQHPGALRVLGILGSGVMGRGVAHAAAAAGYRVILVDKSRDALEGARRQLRKDVRMYQLAATMGRAGGAGVASSSATTTPATAPSADELLARIDSTTELAAIGAAEMIVENITERWEDKRELHAAVDALDLAPVPVAINTSAIPMARFAALYRQPGRVVGMHFMNPVPMMPVVEVIRGAATAPETLAAALSLATALGKRGIVVNDSPGFVTNRVMMLTVNEAVLLLAEAVASAEDIDQLFQTCFGHRMGPLATADLIGLDTVMYSLEVLHRELGDARFAPAPLLRQRVAEGRLGRKSGEGFFSYREVTST